MRNRPFVIGAIFALLTTCLLALSWAPDQRVAQAGTIPSTDTIVTVFMYSDANENGRREPDEAVFKPPFDLTTTLSYQFISSECNGHQAGWFILAAEVSEIVTLQRGCEYDLLIRPFSSDTVQVTYAGTFVATGEEMALYLPEVGTADSLLEDDRPGSPTPGTATPDAQTPTPTPIAEIMPTSTRINLLTPTPVPTSAATPQPTRPSDGDQQRVFLPMISPASNVAR